MYLCWTRRGPKVLKHIPVEYIIFIILNSFFNSYFFCHSFTESDISYLKTIMPTADDAFFKWLLTVDCSEVKVFAMQEGSVSVPPAAFFYYSHYFALHFRSYFLGSRCCV